MVREGEGGGSGNPHRFVHDGKKRSWERATGGGGARKTL